MPLPHRFTWCKEVPQILFDINGENQVKQKEGFTKCIKASQEMKCTPKKRKALSPRPINEKLCFMTYISSKYN
jgi:hypothetical protein